MIKTFTVVTIALSLGLMLLNPPAQAQSSGTAAPQQPAAAPQKPAAPKTQQPPAAKAGQKPAAKAATPLSLKTDKDKVSYAIGMNVGKGLKRDSVDFDLNILMRGIKDAQSGGKLLMTDEEARAALTTLQASLRKKQEEKLAIDRQANQKEGETFLAANKSNEGVVTLPSGLQYKVLTQGTGPKPTATDSVVCNYRGTLINGTEFDSSYKRGQPATFPVTGVIKGWTEALQIMPVGSKWQLFIPSELAYGPAGRPGIPPSATLIFEVELLSIQPKTQTQEPPKQ